MPSRRQFLEQSLGAAVGFGLSENVPESERRLPTFSEAVRRIEANKRYTHYYLPKMANAAVREDQEHAWVLPIQSDGVILYGPEAQGGDANVSNVGSMLQGSIPKSVDLGLFAHTHPAAGALRNVPNGAARLQQLRSGAAKQRIAACDPPSINWGPWVSAGDLTVLAAAEAEKDAEYALVFSVVDSMHVYYLGVRAEAEGTFAAEIGMSQRLANEITHILNKNQPLFRHFTAWSQQKRQGYYQNLRDYAASVDGSVSYKGAGSEQFSQRLQQFVQQRATLFRKHGKALQRAKDETNRVYGKSPDQLKSMDGFHSAVEELGYHFEYNRLV